MSSPGSGPGTLLSPASPRGPAAAWLWDTAVQAGDPPLCAHSLGSSISLFVSFGNENYLLYEGVFFFFSQVDKSKLTGLVWGVSEGCRAGESCSCVFRMF